MKTFRFNMVEIALAIAIIAIGISSVLALFPIGINATREAMNNDFFPETAEYVTNYFRGAALNTWKSGITTNTFSTNPLGTLVAAQLADVKNVDPKGVAFTGQVSGFPDLYSSATAGVYKYERTGYNGEVVFTGWIKAWKVAPGSDIYGYDISDSTLKTMNSISGISADLNQIMQSIMVEVSWAGDNARTFRVDIYNSYYRIIPSP